MKSIYLFLFFMFQYDALAQPCKKIFTPLLEPKSKLVSCEGNHSIERLPDGHFILKRYWMETMMVTHLITYSSSDLQIKDGMYIERWDDGTISSQGVYVDDVREGKWVDGGNHGEYRNGLKEGKWLYYDEDLTLSREEQFAAGVYHGTQVTYDSLGNISYTSRYEHGKLIHTTRDTSVHLIEVMPRFSGCVDSTLTQQELNECSQRNMLQYIYTRINYPSQDRENGIQGKVIVQFTIDKEGTVTDIRFRNGVSPTIQAEVLRLLQTMPAWIPGQQDGKPVPVNFTLPIKFGLQ